MHRAGNAAKRARFRMTVFMENDAMQTGTALAALLGRHAPDGIEYYRRASTNHDGWRWRYQRRSRTSLVDCRPTVDFVERPCVVVAAIVFARDELPTNIVELHYVGADDVICSTVVCGVHHRVVAAR
jgi:hypothetical protein